MVALALVGVLNGQPGRCDTDRCGQRCYGDGKGWCPSSCQCLVVDTPGKGVCVKLTPPQPE